jgi:hypothetical protein
LVEKRVGEWTVGGECLVVVVVVVIEINSIKCGRDGEEREERWTEGEEEEGLKNLNALDNRAWNDMMAPLRRR